ncbi:MAG: DUF2516 family protein, partial [Aeromicrobium sp.]
MFDLFAVQNGIMLLISIVLFVVKAFALIDCLTRKESQFRAIDTLPKQTWMILLGLGLALHLV